MHNGILFFLLSASSGGKGSEFVVHLPLTNKRPGKTAATDLDGESERRILIVEDNPDSRQMLETLLRVDGHEVFTASDGLQGLEAIESQRPDVALIDIGLPQLNGYELAKRVRAEFPSDNLRLVALTGYGREEDRQAVLEAGFDEHLVKPVQPGDLTRVLNKPR